MEDVRTELDPNIRIGGSMMLISPGHVRYIYVHIENMEYTSWSRLLGRQVVT